MLATMTTDTPGTRRLPPIDPDHLTMADVRAGALEGRPVTVLGLARSGISLARFLLGAGSVVTGYDGRPVEDLPATVGELVGEGLTVLAGPDVDPADSWRAAALVTTSPAINPDFPTTEPRLRDALRRLVAAREGGDRTVPALVSEADLFLRLCPSPTIGVTGTKGKTTTAALTAAMLELDQEHPAVLGGNIGRPLIERLPELTPAHRVVIELSELQLPTLSRGTDVAVYTNVTSDHLDRHGSLEAYRAVKRRLAELLDPGGLLVLNADDPVVSGYRTAARARTVTYRLGPPEPGGLGILDEWVVEHGDVRIMPVADYRLPGRHNVSNLLAATAAARSFGLPAETIRSAARGFGGVEHRLELVAEIDGVRFVNDSQGTQPDAVMAAVRAFEPPIVLIAGGRDKGVDLAELGPVVAERVAAAVLIGESGPALLRLFRQAGLDQVDLATSLEQAVTRAAALARDLRVAASEDPLLRPIATVLLSPAAASFDMFVDYEARGRAFKAAVADLRQRGREGAR
jgi:UDP-N-acetylmuramoylalanine--D-glutamate ligase